MKKQYGWRPQLPDVRDYVYSAPKITLPSQVDLRPNCPPVVDQGDLGSCTANAIASAHYFSQKKQKAAKTFQPSRLFVYYNERAIEGTIQYDSGAYIRDGFKTISKQGVCPETLWPYRIPTFRTKPSSAAYKEALNHITIQYLNVSQNLSQLKGCLASGFPFVFGFTVYDSFESYSVTKTGIVPMPSNTESVLGGHAVMAVGYDDLKSWFIVQNSWGTNWGDKGFFYMPYNYLTSLYLSSDFWTMRMVKI